MDLRARVDLRGTANLIAAAKAGSSPHITYISIVGCDQIPIAYYKAKRKAERLIKESGLSWSILRATQFHDLLLQVLDACSKPPVAIVPKGFHFQPVNSGEVAAKLIDITAGQLNGRRQDFGGPRQAEIADWMGLFLASSGSSKSMIKAPLPGRIGNRFRAGRNTVNDGERGIATFEELQTPADETTNRSLKAWSNGATLAMATGNAVELPTTRPPISQSAGALQLLPPVPEVELQQKANPRQRHCRGDDWDLSASSQGPAGPWGRPGIVERPNADPQGRCPQQSLLQRQRFVRRDLDHACRATLWPTPDGADAISLRPW